MGVTPGIMPLEKPSRNFEPSLKILLDQVKQGAREACRLSAAEKRRILLNVSGELIRKSGLILRENKKDVAAAVKNGLSPAMIDRLTLTPERIRLMSEGVKTVAALKDPVGEVLGSWKRPNGLVISKVAVPLGVILIIYESRPNVTVECASLCLKSGNAVLLRGGKEAFHSNAALAAIFSAVLKRSGVHPGCVSLVKTTERKAVDFLLTRDQEINLVIPRGGESLIRRVAEISKIPVIKHYKGVCHVYVDKQADLKKAEDISFNAKMQRTGVCNAMETLLVHKKIAPAFLKRLGQKLQAAGCEVHGDPLTRKILPWAVKAKPGDYGREWLDKILSIKVVNDIGEAMDHIMRYGSGHTEAIVTKDENAARLFTEQVDSSSVMVNASTRFSDGFEYGFGAEIGISTDKIHARGPMGLEGLMSYKYVVRGNGQIRQ